MTLEKAIQEWASWIRKIDLEQKGVFCWFCLHVNITEWIDNIFKVMLWSVHSNPTETNPDHVKNVIKKSNLGLILKYLKVAI